MRSASPVGEVTVIPDPSPLWDDADRMARRDEALDALGTAVRGVDVDSWSGEAADAFREYQALVARAVLKAADDAATASRLLRRHAEVLAWARDALAATAGLPVEARFAREDELRGIVSESATTTAAGLRSIAAGIDGPADEWDALRLVQRQLLTGVKEGAVGMVEGLYRTSMIRFALEPEAYIEEAVSTGIGLVVALRDDPVGLAKSVIDFDTWRTEPVRAAGRLVPELLASAASAGAASGATAGVRALTAARRAADVVEDLPGSRRPGGPDGPSPARLPVSTADDAREALDDLPLGRQDEVRMVDSEGKLTELFERLTRGAEPIDDRPTYRGEWMRLEDGTEIGLRQTSKSQGPTIDIRLPGDGTNWKIHVTQPD